MSASRSLCISCLASLFLLPMCVVSSRADDRPPVVLKDDGRKVHAETILVDGHNDLPWAFRELQTPSFAEKDISQPQTDLHTDIPRLKKGNVKVQFWSVYVPVSTRLQGESLQVTLEQIQFVKKMVKHYPDTFQLCLTSEDIDRALADGKLASLIGMEGGHSIENSIGVLRRLHKEGARYMTLTHSESLDWADSCTGDPTNGGLSAFGEEVVREMNRLGMLVDLSHVSDDTMRDAMRISKAPIIYSHSSARALADHPRNVPDDVLPLVKKNGGVIMVNFYSGFTVPAAIKRGKKRDALRDEWEATLSDEDAVEKKVTEWERSHPMPQGSIHDVVDHIEHLVKKTGVDHVGIGSDYDGIGTLPKQLDDVSTYPLITQELLNRGHSAEDVHKIMGRNVLRVFRDAERVAKEMQESKTK